MHRVRFLFISLFAVCFFAQIIAGDIVVNEFMAGNVQFLENPDMPGNYPDWIELYNNSAERIHLGGLYLTDNEGNYTKWIIPEGLSIASKGFIVFYADGFPGLGITHTNFKLSSEGGFILLIDRDGQTIHDSIFYDRQVADVSRGRFPDGGETLHFMKGPTPGEANFEGYSQLCEQASFSHQHGFYSEAFQLSLNSSQPGTRIYYSLNGYSPSDTMHVSVKEYSAPININRTTIVRTITFNPACLSPESLSQSYIFLDDVLSQPASPYGYPTNWGHTGTGDYEMDPEVVNSPAYQDEMHEALLSIPTLSLVMNRDEWFGTDGIYQEGELEKRKVSIEMFSARDSGQFQINGAVMIVGGTSVNRWKSDKLSMRISFDIEYGQGKLNFPVFDNGVESYNSLTIDAGLNNTWHYGGGVAIKDRGDVLSQNDIAQYTRDDFVAQLQNQMGSYGPHGKKVHLYLNGLYWGMHWLHERPDEHFAAARMGGSADDYSVLKHSYENVEHGTNQSYIEMLDLLDRDLYSPSSLGRIMEQLDVEDLIKYIILNFTLGNSDWDHQNWYATCNEESPEGRWRFHSWDAEHVMEGSEFFRIGKTNYGDPTYIHDKLMKNREYRLLFMEQVEKLLITEGPLTVDGLKEKYTQLTNELFLPVIAESARWGDNRKDIPYTRDIEWQTENDWIMNQFIPGRPSHVIDQLKAMGIFSDIPSPVFYHQNDTFSTGFILKGDIIDYKKTDHQIYYTTNLEDPVLDGYSSGGGDINSDARELSEALRPTNSVIIKARATDGQVWSSMEQIVAIVKTNFSGLKITEINYDPMSGALPGNNYEFIELKNVGTEAIDLSFAEISGGIDYIFPFGSVIGPGEYIVLGSNSEAFKSRYNFLPDGAYLKNLSGDGETISMCDFTGDTILSFRYETVFPWPPVSDWDGYTIVSALTNPAGDPSSPEYYTYSCSIHGSPGESEESCLSSTVDHLEMDPVLNAYPNPFESYLEIEFVIKEEGYTSLNVYDIYGRLIEHLVGRYLLPGSYKISWEPDATVKGIYIINLHANKLYKSTRIIRH